MSLFRSLRRVSRRRGNIDLRSIGLTPLRGYSPYVVDSRWQVPS